LGDFWGADAEIIKTQSCKGEETDESYRELTHERTPSPGSAIAVCDLRGTGPGQLVARRTVRTLRHDQSHGPCGYLLATRMRNHPTQLRRCEPGEQGAVISRYYGMHGYDWIAIPILPYLYAVNDAEDIPGLADARTVAHLRDQYRRRCLEAMAPDTMQGQPPRGT
jgi:hypothetical protein